MKKTALSILLFLAFCFSKVKAQDSNEAESATYSNSVHRLEKELINNYHPGRNQIKRLCENACVFIRFKILKGGYITDLAFSGKNTRTFSIVTNALRKAFESPGLKLVLSKELQSDSTTYLLPFIYYYNTGCNLLSKQEIEKLNKLDTSYHRVNREQFSNAISNMLNFKDEKSNTLNYTILDPIKIGKNDHRQFL
jgi:hypothetical protein